MIHVYQQLFKYCGHGPSRRLTSRNRRQEKSYGKSSGKGWGKSSYDSYGGRLEEVVGKTIGENVPMAASNWVNDQIPWINKWLGLGSWWVSLGSLNFIAIWGITQWPFE